MVLTAPSKVRRSRSAMVLSLHFSRIPADLDLRTLDGAVKTIRAEELQAFGAELRGTLIDANSPNYDQARTIWNAMIDRHPGLIARCCGAADVMCAVRFAREHGIVVAVRGGGHNIAG